MSDKIPADVKATALLLYRQLGRGSRVDEDAIANAIFTERVRCAEVARRMLVFADTTSGADEAIPQAIMDPEHWAALNPALLKELVSPEAS